MDNKIFSSFIYDEGVRYLVQEVILSHDSSKLEMDVSTVVTPQFSLPDNSEDILDDMIFEENDPNLPFTYSASINDDRFAVTCTYWMNSDADDEYKALIRGALMTGVRCTARKIEKQMETERSLH